MRFFCLDYGYQHARAELFLSSGLLDSSHNDVTPCKDSCYVCTGSYKKYFSNVFKESVIHFLKSRKFSDAVPMMIRADELIDLLWTEEDWKIEIFDKNRIQKYNVESLFLLLIAARIIIWEE